jgi:hypothetical protein
VDDRSCESGDPPQDVVAEAVDDDDDAADLEAAAAVDHLDEPV